MLGLIGSNLQAIQKASSSKKPEETKKASPHNIAKLRAVSDEGVSLDEAEAYKIERSLDKEEKEKGTDDFQETLYAAHDYQTQIEAREEAPPSDQYTDPPRLWLVKDINHSTPEEALETYKEIQAMGPIKVSYDENEEPLVSNGSCGVLINKKQF